LTLINSQAAEPAEHHISRFPLGRDDLSEFHWSVQLTGRSEIANNKRVFERCCDTQGRSGLTPKQRANPTLRRK